MIILTRLQTFGAFMTVYELTGKDARELAAITGHPGAVKVRSATLTLFHTPLDNGEEFGEYKGTGDDASAQQLDGLEGLT